MAITSQLTIAGNLTADPELRKANDKSVVAFTIAVTPRSFDRQKNEWVDGEAVFMRCSAWEEFAENIAASLTKGQRVIATGVLKTRKWQDKDGNPQSMTELQVDEIGASLRYATTQTTKRPRGGGGYGQQAQGNQDSWASSPQNDEDIPF